MILIYHFIKIINKKTNEEQEHRFSLKDYHVIISDENYATIYNSFIFEDKDDKTKEDNKEVDSDEN